MLVNIKFSLDVCKNLTKNELDNLSDTARDFFYFLQSFRNKLKIHGFCKFMSSRRPYPGPGQCNLQ